MTVAEIVTGKEIIPGTPNDIYKLIDWLREYFKNNQIDKGAIPGIDSEDSLFEALFKLTPFGLPFAIADEVV